MLALQGIISTNFLYSTQSKYLRHNLIGDIWITPSGIDKGSLTPRDIVQVKPDGTVIGIHKPSIELPFHAQIYRRRNDIKAVVHAPPLRW